MTTFLSQLGMMHNLKYIMNTHIQQSLPHNRVVYLTIVISVIIVVIIRKTEKFLCPGVTSKKKEVRPTPNFVNIYKNVRSMSVNYSRCSSTAEAAAKLIGRRGITVEIACL